MNLNIREIEYIFDHHGGGATTASQKLFIAQPSLSRSAESAWKNEQLTLFTRVKNSSSGLVTRKGRSVYRRGTADYEGNRRTLDRNSRSLHRPVRPSGGGRPPICWVHDHTDIILCIANVSPDRASAGESSSAGWSSFCGQGYPISSVIPFPLSS